MTRVLYIDDEVGSLRFGSIEEELTEEGLLVSAVGRVADVLQLLERKPAWDVIALDLLMPPEAIYSLEETNGGTTTGLRLLKELRTRWPAIPVVVISVRDDEFAQKEALRLGAADYLEKPVAGIRIAQALKTAAAVHAAGRKGR